MAVGGFRTGRQGRTLLSRAVSGLQKLAAGDIRWDGTRWPEGSAAAGSRACRAFIPQRAQVPPASPSATRSRWGARRTSSRSSARPAATAMPVERALTRTATRRVRPTAASPRSSAAASCGRGPGDRRCRAGTGGAVLIVPTSPPRSLDLGRDPPRSAGCCAGWPTTAWSVDPRRPRPRAGRRGGGHCGGDGRRPQRRRRGAPSRCSPRRAWPRSGASTPRSTSTAPCTSTGSMPRHNRRPPPPVPRTSSPADRERGGLPLEGALRERGQGALDRADQRARGRRAAVTPYQCDVCGGWHLTSRA